MGYQSVDFLKRCYRRIKEKRQEKLYKIEQEELNKILLDKEAEEILQKEFQREQQQWK
jgi:phosphopantothenate synthetase